MGHEHEILTRIAQLRSQSSSFFSETEQIQQGDHLSSLLKELNIAVENYPELKANAQFIHLHLQIEDMENQLQAIRRTYNAAVTEYNNRIEMFPSSVIASLRGHEMQDLIEIPEIEMEQPKVEDLFKR